MTRKKTNRNKGRKATRSVEDVSASAVQKQQSVKLRGCVKCVWSYIKKHPRIGWLLVLLIPLIVYVWFFWTLELHAEFTSLYLSGVSDFETRSGTDFALSSELIGQADEMRCAERVIWKTGDERPVGMSLSVPTRTKACTSLAFSASRGTDSIDKPQLWLVPRVEDDTNCELLVRLELQDHHSKLCTLSKSKPLILKLARLPTVTPTTVARFVNAKEISGEIFGTLPIGPFETKTGQRLQGLRELRVIKKLVIRFGPETPIFGVDCELGTSASWAIDGKTSTTTKLGFAIDLIIRFVSKKLGG